MSSDTATVSIFNPSSSSSSVLIPVVVAVVVVVCLLVLGAIVIAIFMTKKSDPWHAYQNEEHYELL